MYIYIHVYTYVYCVLSVITLVSIYVMIMTDLESSALMIVVYYEILKRTCKQNVTVFGILL